MQQVWWKREQKSLMGKIERNGEGESIRDVKVGRSVQDGTKNIFYKKYKNTKWDSWEGGPKTVSQQSP